MEFPPRVIYPRRFHSSPAQAAQHMSQESAAAVSAPNLRDKLATLVERNKKVKIAYHQLRSQIAFGLVEAGEVFESLAIPLMKLVGLKSSEMESEGRLSTFIFKTEKYQMDTSQNGTWSHDLNNQIRNSKEEDYAAKAKSAGKEILHKHKEQLKQLVHMLKHIETHVNSHHDDIFQMIENRRTSFQELIQKSLYYLSSVHSQNHDTFPLTVKLIRHLSSNINEVLGSVDSGVSDLMEALSKNMGKPMSKYAGNLADEIKFGPCVQLMNVVNEMERANENTMRELEDARERIRLAEERKVDALSRLKKAEDEVQSLKRNDKFLLPACQKTRAASKRLDIGGSRENEENLLWDLLSKRRKERGPESPMGNKELIKQADTKQKPSVYNLRTTKIQTRSSSQKPCPDALIPLGLPPSARRVTRSSVK